MTISVNSNSISSFAIRAFNQTSQGIDKATREVSTGLRINKPGDDAAGLSIAAGIDTVVRSTDNSQRNIAQGIAVVDTVFSGLNAVKDELDNIKEIAVRARNSTYTEDELAAMQRDVVRSVEVINEIAQNTSFNDRDLLSGNEDISILFGVEDGDTLSLDLETNGTVGRGVEISISSTANGSLGEGVLTALNAFNIGSNTVAAEDRASFGQSGTLADLDTMLNNVGRMLTETSSDMNVLKTQEQFQSVFAEGAKTLRSSIYDSDVASATATIAREQIRQSAAGSMLTQANSINSVALNILP
ncbi:MAG: flagellin [Candidatus Caenarcaniphilales bacterium]|nr:flagellin [Candidatus Caenarcaniphilales bacterium]